MVSYSEVYSENYNIIPSMDSNNNNLELNASQMSRTDLESHVNVVVLGNNCAIIKRTGRHSGAEPFAPDYESLHKVPIVGSDV